MDSRTIKIITGAVWVVAAAVIVGLLFMRGATPKPATVAPAGATPIVYEFTSDT